jgi:hypothetical protein
VEAKKPSAAIATKENYYQVVRYAWNSQTPLAVLTDFQQFHVIDCRFKPDPDTALNHALTTTTMRITPTVRSSLRSIGSFRGRPSTPVHYKNVPQNYLNRVEKPFNVAYSQGLTNL